MASSKNYTEVLIGGKVFTLSGFESEDYLQKESDYPLHNYCHPCPCFIIFYAHRGKSMTILWKNQPHQGYLLRHLPSSCLP